MDGVDCSGILLQQLSLHSWHILAFFMRDCKENMSQMNTIILKIIIFSSSSICHFCHFYPGDLLLFYDPKKLKSRSSEMNLGLHPEVRLGSMSSCPWLTPNGSKTKWTCLSLEASSLEDSSLQMIMFNFIFSGIKF